VRKGRRCPEHSALNITAARTPGTVVNTTAETGRVKQGSGQLAAQRAALPFTKVPKASIFCSSRGTDVLRQEKFDVFQQAAQ